MTETLNTQPASDNSTANVSNPSTIEVKSVRRDEKGRLLPGSVLNPKGKTRKSFRDYFTEEEELKLIDKIKAEVDGETRSDILKMVVEHIFGKPKQPLVGGDEDDPAIPITILGEKNVPRNSSSPQNQESQETN